MNNYDKKFDINEINILIYSVDKSCYTGKYLFDIWGKTYSTVSTIGNTIRKIINNSAKSITRKFNIDKIFVNNNAPVLHLEINIKDSALLYSKFDEVIVVAYRKTDNNKYKILSARSLEIDNTVDKFTHNIFNLY